MGTNLANTLSIASYNMFGFHNGLSMLYDLCGSHSIIGVQEHWLRGDELIKLSRVHPDFNFYGASGMHKALSTALLRGRPFGGVGILWHRSLNSFITPIAKSDDGRCIAVKLSYGGSELLLINVYFPCFNPSVEYREDVSVLCAFIENILMSNAYRDVIIFGDTYFDLSPNLAGFNILNSMLVCWNIVSCDDLPTSSIDPLATNHKGGVIHTYFNQALNSSSRIDHFFVSSHLSDRVSSVSVIDQPALNMSDHRSISL